MTTRIKSWGLRLAITGLMVVGLLGGLTVALESAGAANSQATVTVAATGLDGPRGMTFGPDGALYVTEAGVGGDGPCITVSAGFEACYGPSGAVTRILSATQQRILTGLPSLARPNGNEATGPHDISLLPDGSGYMVAGLGATPTLRTALGTAGEDFGQLVRLTAANGMSNTADLAGYEQTANPDGSIVDSNPYALVAFSEWQVVADAGGNTLLEVADGAVFRTTIFPTRTVTSPVPGPAQIPMESVPNSVAVGPDGAYYVGELTGFPFPVDGARVYRLVPGQTPEIYADGFTNIIDIAFDAADNLYVLEIDADNLLGGDPTGALIQVAPDKTKTLVFTQGLTVPTSIALSPTGGTYVANSGIVSGTGQVLRIDQCPPGDPACQEPAALPDPLAIVATGEAEVDDMGLPGQGDPDGLGRAIITLKAEPSRVCIQATVADIAQPTAAHIHEGAAGENGPPVVAFTNLISGSLISGCVTDTATALVETIRDNPADYYLNVHNAEFPAGAVRGQLAGAEATLSTLYLPLIMKE